MTTKVRITAGALPLDQPTMRVPGSIVHKESDAPGDAHLGFAMQIEGSARGFGSSIGAKKGNRSRLPPAPAERAERASFTNARNGRTP